MAIGSASAKPHLSLSHSAARIFNGMTRTE
jgi:hypothetical protein